jgi:DNA replication factor GINS
MYAELYRVWKSENERPDLERLPSDFYSKAAEYMKKLREEGRMLDKRTLKTSLLREEMHNASFMIQELIRIRNHKIVARMVKGEDIDKESLTPEEQMIYSKTSNLSEMIRSFSKDIIRGQVVEPKLDVEKRKMILRFLKEVPGIVGSDLKTYGPFKEEDVAALPIENSRILIKQGLAERVEVT